MRVTAESAWNNSTDECFQWNCWLAFKRHLTFEENSLFPCERPSVWGSGWHLQDDELQIRALTRAGPDGDGTAFTQNQVSLLIHTVRFIREAGLILARFNGWSLMNIIFMAIRRTEKSLVFSYQFIYWQYSVSAALIDILGLGLLILDFIFVGDSQYVKLTVVPVWAVWFHLWISFDTCSCITVSASNTPHFSFTIWWILIIFTFWWVDNPAYLYMDLWVVVWKGHFK